VSYLHVGSARYRLNDGTQVRDRGGHSLQWRAGSRVGRVIETGNGGTVMPYVRLGYAYEQGNRNRVSVNDTTLNADLGGSRLEAGAGVEARLGKAHSLYVDVGYAKGKRFEQSRMVTVGYQYRW
jgi:outer membrane autotransporter protein